MAMNNMMLAQVCVRLFIFVRRFSSSAREESRLLLLLLFSTIDVGGRVPGLLLLLLRSYRYHECSALTHIVSPPLYLWLLLLFSPTCLPKTHQLMKDMQVGSRSICYFSFLLLPLLPLLQEKHVVVDVFPIENEAEEDGRCSSGWVRDDHTSTSRSKHLPFFANVLLLVTIAAYSIISI
jgi:hypothetical protein